MRPNWVKFGISLHVGKEKVFNENVKEITYNGSEVVLELMASLLNQDYSVTMDNLFLSPDLFENLCNQNTDTIGTLCQNTKGLCSEIKNLN